MKAKDYCNNFSHKLVNYYRELTFLLLVFFLTLIATNSNAQSPVAANGKLKVVGTQMVSETGTAIQLRGLSSHGLGWFTDCYNFNSLSSIAKDWGADVFRVAVYPTEKPDQTMGGYEGNPTFWKKFVDEQVDLCGLLGIYCIIDWHVLTPGNPADPTYLPMAKEFWAYMSAKHAGKKHVLYEICNEPNGVDWTTVKTYAETIIPIIRANDASTIILVGSPTWSSDVDIAANNPITGQTNIMYSFHFYAATHAQNYRDKITTAISKGLAIFATEWGTTSASGDGSPNLTESDSWMSFLATNKISWCNWSYSDKNETSAVLIPYSASEKLWNNPSASGTYVKSKINTPADSWAGTANIKPAANVSAPLNGSYYLPNTAITIKADAVDVNGTISSVAFYVDGVLLGTDASAPYSILWTPTAAKDYIITAVATDNASATGTSLGNTVHIQNTITQTAYPNGIPTVISGATIGTITTINSINFDNGGEGIAYHDLDGVHKGPAGTPRAAEGVDVESTTNIGYIYSDEWLEYTVNVTDAGTYDFTINCATALPITGKIHLELDGVVKTAVTNIPSSGSWGSYQPNTITGISLASGIQVLRIYFDKGYFNISNFSFKYTGGGTTVTGVTVNPTSATVGIGQTTTLVATVSPSSATNKSVTWTSSNTSVATVSVTGVVTGVAVGSATITVTTVDQAKTATAAITVAVPVPVTGVTISSSSISIFQGSTSTLTATVTPSNATNKSVTWSTSSSAIATVSSTGVVTGIAPGTATITVTTVDGSKTDICSVTVNSNGDNIALNKPATSSSIENAGYPASACNDGNTTTRWSSAFSDPQWVMIDLQATYTINKVVLNWEAAAGKNFEIQVSANGTSWTSIYTTTTGNGGIQQLSVTGSGRYIRMYGTVRTTPYGYSLYEFEVYGTTGTVPVTGVTVSPVNAEVGVNATTTLTATVQPSNASNKSVTWVSSNSAIATVSSTGIVTGKSAGSTTITVTTVDGAKTASASITVTNTTVPVTGVTIAPTSASVNVGSTTGLTATVLPSNATNKLVTWSSNNISVATVSSAGIVTGVAVGNAIINVTTVDGSFTASSTITVTNNTTPCENPVAITLSFAKDGSGEFCYYTTQVMSYINSWNLDLLEINGVDFTNKWANSYPAAIDGKWYIHYKGSFAWSHFEAVGSTKSGEIRAESNISINNKIKGLSVYPNPLRSGELVITGSDNIINSSLNIYELSGKQVFTSKIISEKTILSKNVFEKGIFLIELSNGSEKQVVKLIVE